MKQSLRHSVSMELRAIRTLHRVTPAFFPTVTANRTLGALLPYAAVYCSARILSELAQQRRPEVLWKWVLLTAIVTGLLSIGSAFLKEREATLLEDIWGRKEILYCKKAVSMDFADADKQETRDLRAQIAQNENWHGLGLMNAAIVYMKLIKGIIGVLGGVALTVELFALPVPESAGSLRLLGSPLFVLPFGAVIIGISLLAGLLYSKAADWENRLAKEATFGNRVYFYVMDFPDLRENQLDIRIYRQQALLRKTFVDSGSVFSADGAFGRAARGPMGICNALAGSISALITGFLYAFTCLKAWAGAFDVGSVTQYVGAATALAGAVYTLLEAWGDMTANTEHLETTFRYLDQPNHMYQGSLTTEKRADRQYQVEFRNVSFRYPGSESWALKNVSIRFRVGKRLAIVGENGSGKTTFIKLLCRLYDPQEGQILLNGIDIRKYRYDEYMAIFSVVFQDFQLISQSLGSNVAGSVRYDPNRVRKALIDAGFGPRLDTLPQGLDTLLYKDYGEEGIEISGGEAQKIAIARALYKDAPFIILDEPTAALDPIAEAEIYEKFQDISGDRTTVFISHRLSSCKFCDEILVFQNGAIVQQGTHEALLSQPGRYAALWNAQAQYYQDTPGE